MVKDDLKRDFGFMIHHSSLNSSIADRHGHEGSDPRAFPSMKNWSP
jgi:hypothetical protein